MLIFIESIFIDITTKLLLFYDVRNVLSVKDAIKTRNDPSFSLHFISAQKYFISHSYVISYKTKCKLIFFDRNRSRNFIHIYERNRVINCLLKSFNKSLRNVNAPFTSTSNFPFQTETF